MVHLVFTAVYFFGIFLVANALHYLLTAQLLIQNAISNLIACSVLAAFTFPFVKRKCFNGKIKTENRAVLITGCDSGFGHMLARHLDACGFCVFATCLFPSGSGAKELKDGCSERLQILEMDVTDDKSVTSAKINVEKSLGARVLWAVVNNAGVLKGLSVEFTDIQDYRDCLEVNTIGTVRVTKAFLPLLKQSRGRIVNITSLGGRITLPFLSPYVMSKFAAVSFTDCLRAELNVWGIRVISVEPECFKTGIADPEVISNRIDQILSSLPEDLKNEYGEIYLKKLKKIAMMYTNATSSKVENVVMALDSAIRSENPDDVYSPSRNVLYGILLRIFVMLPKCVRASIINFVLHIICSLVPERCRSS